MNTLNWSRLPSPVRRLTGGGLAVALSAACLMAAPASVAQAATASDKTLTPSADSYISLREPGQPHGDRPYLYATTDETFAFLKFNTEGVVPEGATVESVTLRLYVLNNDNPAGHPVVGKTSTAWHESSLVINNAPGRPTADLNGTVEAAENSWVDIPLSSTEVNNSGETAYELKYSNWYSNFRFASKESDHAPQLVVKTVGEAATAPVDAPALLASPAPAAASEAGFANRAFNENFDSTDGIDLTGTGQSDKNFYLDRPFSQPLPASDVSVSGGVMTLNQSSDTANVGLSSVSSRTGRGQAFQYGYYEARMKFDENNAYRSRSYPSFWMVPRETVDGSTTLQKYSELDVFEAYHEDYSAPYHWFVGSVHDWTRNPQTHLMNGGNNIYKLPASVNLNEFHTYGLLWTKGQLVWYFDGQEVLRQSYSPTEAPNPNHVGLPVGAFSTLDQHTNGMAIILGSGVNYPMQVDWVRVWR